MGKIFCVMGKSASGKDTIYNKILQDDSLMLSRIIPYTTRPIGMERHRIRTIISAMKRM